MARRLLRTTVRIDHSDALRNVPDHSYNRERDVHIRFARDHPDHGSSYTVQAWGKVFPQDGGGIFQGHVGSADNVIRSDISALREVWQESVLRRFVIGAHGRRYPFVDGWDLSGGEDREGVDEVWLELARAGHRLFSVLFKGPGQDQGMREITERLVAALREGEHVITMESDDLLVPWPMLYTPSDTEPLWGADPVYSIDNFWGCSHVIEHSFSRVDGYDSRIRVQPKGLALSMNVDENVDDDFPDTPFVGPMREFFATHEHTRDRLTVRTRKDELAVAIQDPDFPDHIMYFGCHAEVNTTVPGGPYQSYFTLGDQQKIYGTDFLSWLPREQLPTRPFVFVGACQGGQLSSSSYPAFGYHLLGCGARCLLGPQIDLPLAFAREYSTRLFDALLEPGARLGDLVRQLAKDFAEQHRNPLGLNFSLYRGIDLHFALEQS